MQTPGEIRDCSLDTKSAATPILSSRHDSQRDESILTVGEPHDCSNTGGHYFVYPRNRSRSRIPIPCHRSYWQVSIWEPFGSVYHTGFVFTQSCRVVLSMQTNSGTLAWPGLPPEKRTPMRQGGCGTAVAAGQYLLKALKGFTVDWVGTWGSAQ